MNHDSTAVETVASLVYDLVIVGAGPAGLSVAREFFNTNFRVLILEDGLPKVRPAQDSDMQMAADGYSYDLNASRGRGFGGSSGLWNYNPGWRVRPLDPIDFEEKHYIPLSGWPIAYDEIKPYYELAHQRLGFGDFRYDGGYWLERFNLDAGFLPEDALELSNFRYGRLDGFTALVADFDAYKNIELIFNSRVTIIDHNAGGRIHALEVTGPDKRKFRVKAKFYVLAAGAVDNARLMMISRVGSSNELVGRYFMEHPHVETGYIELAPGFDYRRLSVFRTKKMQESGMADPGSNYFSLIMKLNRETILKEEIGNCLVVPTPIPNIYAEPGVGSLNELRRLKLLGIKSPRNSLAQHRMNVLKCGHKVVVQKAMKLLGMGSSALTLKVSIEAEQVPNKNSRIVLDSILDECGVPKPKMEWSVSEFDRHTIRRTLEVLDQQLRDSKVGKVVQMFGDSMPLPQIAGGSHHMGTTRMAASSENGVVDKNCKVYGSDSLYVAGSSIFPTGGASNPTLTIIALSIRLAEHLKNRFKDKGAGSV